MEKDVLGNERGVVWEFVDFFQPTTQPSAVFDFLKPKLDYGVEGFDAAAEGGGATNLASSTATFC